MLNVIRMPQMGVSDESAILCKWLVREGERICRGQPVFSLETDKATFQYEAETDGFFVRILTGEGEEAAVGSPVGIMSDTETTISKSELDAFLHGQKSPDKGHQPRTEAPASSAQKENRANTSGQNSVPDKQPPEKRVSPRARKTADRVSVDIAGIRSGTGPGGRIIERDVLDAFQPNTGSAEHVRKTTGIYSGRPLTPGDRVGTRQIRAETAGRTGFVSRTFDARKILNQGTPRNRLSPGTAVCSELARLLVKTPELNARRHGDRIYEYNTVHLRLTADTPSCTLKPVIRCAETYTPEELAILIRNATGRCRRFDAKPQEFQEGTFTVADFSAYGVDCFTPELTPPELGALGIGAVTMQTTNSAQGGTEAVPAIRLTLVYDRAGVDALRAARFLNELALLLEGNGTKR